MTNRRPEAPSPFAYFLFAVIVLALTFFIGYVRGVKRVNSDTKNMLDEIFYGIGVETRLNLYPPGLIVSDVQPGTPAKKSGLRKYDVILRINDGDAKFDRLEYITRSAAIVQLKIKRGDRIFKISVTPEPMQRKVIVVPAEIICSDCAVPYDTTPNNIK